MFVVVTPETAQSVVQVVTSNSSISSTSNDNSVEISSAKNCTFRF